MAERSLFFTSGSGDGGPYSQDQLRLPWKMLNGAPGVNVGVFLNQLNDLLVTSTGNNNITVATGRALVDGTFYENDAASSNVTASPAVGTTGRKVVLRKSWAARTVRIAIISSADGTATIPAVTQTDGTTWDIPLASFTITTGGVIGALTDLRQAIQRGAWTLISHQNTGAVSSVDWSNIPSNFTRFRLTWSIVSLSSSGTTQLRFNNDSGANYNQQMNQSSATTNTASRTTGATSISPGASDTSVRVGEALIGKTTAASRAGVQMRDMSGAATTIMCQLSGDWANTSAVINRITLLASAGNFGSGSIFTLEGAP